MGRNILIILIVLIPVVLLSLDEFNVVITEVGQQVPKFNSITIDEQEFDIGNYEGQIVIINLFATYCLPCKPELKSLENDFWKKYNEQGVVVVGIGRGDNKEKLLQLRDELNISFPIIADSTQNIFNLFAKKYIPRNYLINRAGKITFQTHGYDDLGNEKLEEELQKLLNR